MTMMMKIASTYGYLGGSALQHPDSRAGFHDSHLISDSAILSSSILNESSKHAIPEESYSKVVLFSDDMVSMQSHIHAHKFNNTSLLLTGKCTVQYESSCS